MPQPPPARIWTANLTTRGTRHAREGNISSEMSAEEEEEEEEATHCPCNLPPSLSLSLSSLSLSSSPSYEGQDQERSIITFIGLSVRRPTSTSWLQVISV